MHKLAGRRVAILATQGFEQSELEKPRTALDEAGAITTIVSLEEKYIRGWKETDWGDNFKVDVILTQTNPEHYDALLLPGGVMNPDKLRVDDRAVKFVQGFFSAGKPVAAICHGPQILINAHVVKGRTMTSYPSIKLDLINASANWIDEAVVVDRGLVTSRKPADLPFFIAKTIEQFASSVRPGTSTAMPRQILQTI